MFKLCESSFLRLEYTTEYLIEYSTKTEVAINYKVKKPRKHVTLAVYRYDALITSSIILNPRGSLGATGQTSDDTNTTRNEAFNVQSKNLTDAA